MTAMTPTIDTSGAVVVRDGADGAPLVGVSAEATPLDQRPAAVYLARLAVGAPAPIRPSITSRSRHIGRSANVSCAPNSPTRSAPARLPGIALECRNMRHPNNLDIVEIVGVSGLVA